MILQALTEHYETLAAQGKIAKPGWADAKISFALYINDAGELERTASVKTEQGKGRTPPPGHLPAGPGKTHGGYPP